MLRKIFLANAVFSTINAIALVFASQKMAVFLLAPELDLWGLGAADISFILGIGLFIFAAYVAFVAINLSKLMAHAKVIIAADWLWVASTILLFIFAAFMFSASGMVFFAIVAFIVAGFAIAQTRFLKQD